MAVAEAGKALNHDHPDPFPGDATASAAVFAGC